ncbi:MAG: pirin family protein [Pirellulales bacterium]
MKRVQSLKRGVAPHWVGDGFPVRTMFSVHDMGQAISPFLLLDYAGPAEFKPSEKQRGVGEHPHRGFETVTIVYQGELEHRDSAGNHGRIGPGDVQWMTAASGVVHEEWHEREFDRRGGMFEVVQLWVNLRANDKMSPPKYQEILNRQIPTVELDGGSKLRVIAGESHGAKGPAHTFTPVNLWDLRLQPAAPIVLTFPAGYTTMLLVLKGSVLLNGQEELADAELAVMDPAGEELTVQAARASTVLVLSGQPIDEPIVSYGPFVMNTEDEIQRAIEDYQSGRMGRISASQ